MDERLGLSGVGQVEPLRRIRRHLGVNGTLAGQRVQSGNGDGLGVNVKVTTLAGFSQARSLGLDILRPAGRAREEDLAAPAALRHAFIALSERLAWVNRHRRTPIRLRELAAADCGGGAGYCPSEFGLGAALTADGALYPCASLVGRPEYDCGTATAPDYARLRLGLPADTSGCGNCAATGCRGRCPSLALLSPRAGKLDCLMRLAVTRQSKLAASTTGTTGMTGRRVIPIENRPAHAS